ncbi:PA14 domain-containing protein [Emticicia sp. BO119]|uniref:PA14 domain-containing protein n=1 Tax=Emticicia sp. BO119 TaxID=2757768 RepID=UPI0015F05B7B|nr:PA14 domain-containing protein [Emticicia sp. BO119]MBA4854072.1 PQQ-dependent sugar dehydrogenase [Emticicia sp. BO119]
MKKIYSFKKVVSLFIFLFLSYISCAQLPSGFNDQLFLGGWNQVVGFTFDANGRMFVWEKAGKVWIVENGVKKSQPFIDISPEVGDWRDFGMVGFALDPNFISNGNVYLLYVVDRHHLLKFGTSQYSASTNEYYNATIGRITRYTATAGSNFSQIDYNSRKVLLGETKSTGMPVLHESHGVGQIVFGTDGTLLASLGDGASYASADQGSAGETYWQTALNDGIITPQENVGAYRCQMLNSLSGKIIRIDPNTGDGIPSNPYWNPNNPRSAQSRVWAVGLRNPYRFTIKTGTGSPDRNDGNPGTFFIGDVGWNTKEELNILTNKGQNFGWPSYEGMEAQGAYNNNTYKPATYDRPKLDWRNGSNARGYINGVVSNVGSSLLSGSSFGGNASTGGVWYTGSSFPAEYKNTYFHADYGGGWIRNISFDENLNPEKVKNFVPDGSGSIVFVGQQPFQDALLYVKYPGEIRRITYTQSGNKFPTAIASSDKTFGTSPLTIQFTGDQSYDPENGNLSYLWEFGDGSISTLANPQKIFNTSGNTAYNVKLTVTDNGGAKNSASILISPNNTPPIINASTLNEINTFQVSGKTYLTLDCSASDKETSDSQLNYSWQVALFHNEHNHPEPPINQKTTSAVISPVGCDGATYWYRITLTVQDTQGLTATLSKDIYPNCGAAQQSITFNSLANKLNTDTPFAISAVSTSTLPISYYVLSGPATVVGNVVILSGLPGTVTVAATQPGNTDFAPARPVFQSFAVTKKVDTPTNPPVQNGDGNGLAATYFDNIDLTNPKVARIDSKIDFNWATGSPATGIANDTYSARWIGEILAKYTETYTLSVSADDGIRVWINNQLVLDRWVDQSFTTYNFMVNLVAGQKVPVKVEYYENGGDAAVKLEWASVSQVKEVIPQSQLFGVVVPIAPTTPPDGNGNGLAATYYDNANLTTPKLTRLDNKIDFNWGSGSPDPSIGNETYSVRWQGQILPRYSEQYTFSITSDDGVKVWINNQLKVNKWVAQSSVTNTFTIDLTAGQKTSILIEYYENTGNAMIKLEWASTSQVKEIIPQSQLFGIEPDPIVGTGLTGSYYNNRDLTSLKLTRIDKTINFNWGNGSPASSISNDTYSVRWEGFLLPRTTQVYNIMMTGDDGIKVWIDNRLIINKWIDQSPTTHSYAILLSGGVKVPVRIEYYENTGGAVARLEWSGPSQSREVIPQSQLFPKTGTSGIINNSEVPEIIGNFISMKSEENDILLFPNPAGESVTIQLNKLANRAVKLQMIDERGSILHQESFSNKTEIDLSLKSYHGGLYFIIIEDETQEVGKSVKKLIIQH